MNPKIKAEVLTHAANHIRSAIAEMERIMPKDMIKEYRTALGQTYTACPEFGELYQALNRMDQRVLELNPTLKEQS